MKTMQVILGFVLVFGAPIGYVKNIIKFTQCDFEKPLAEEVIRAYGFIPPVGAIIGWIDLGE